MVHYLFRLLICAAFLFIGKLVVHADQPQQLPEPARKLFEKGMQSKHYPVIAKLDIDTFATTDEKSYVVVWKPKSEPKKWIVSLHGSRGFGTDDLAIWHRNLGDRSIGLVSLQWWLGEGDSPQDYYSPEVIYRELAVVLKKLKIPPGNCMFHGFSRGSANLYAVAALDAGKGDRFGSLFVASSGGMQPGFPPNRFIENGSYGKLPLSKTKWVVVSGDRDPNPERDGTPAMRRTAEWLKKQGATIELSIDDPEFGHGALQLRNENASKVIGLFESIP